MAQFEIRPARDTDRVRVNLILKDEWHGPKIVSRGKAYDGRSFPAFIAWQGDGIVGLLTYRIEGDECEVMTLNSFTEGIGVGSALIDAVKAVAKASRCRRLWLVTTNDNTSSLRFYQRRGFVIVAWHHDAMTEMRRLLKPEIPEVIDGTPVRDEIELEMTLP
jgi:GNAT superfamily N-acetyltransferase